MQLVRGGHARLGTANSQPHSCDGNNCQHRNRVGVQAAKFNYGKPPNTGGNSNQSSHRESSAESGLAGLGPSQFRAANPSKAHTLPH